MDFYLLVLTNFLHWQLLWIDTWQRQILFPIRNQYRVLIRLSVRWKTFVENKPLAFCRLMRSRCCFLRCSKTRIVHHLLVYNRIEFVYRNLRLYQLSKIQSISIWFIFSFLLVDFQMNSSHSPIIEQLPVKYSEIDPMH